MYILVSAGKKKRELRTATGLAPFLSFFHSFPSFLLKLWKLYSDTLKFSSVIFCFVRWRILLFFFFFFFTLDEDTKFRLNFSNISSEEERDSFWKFYDSRLRMGNCNTEPNLYNNSTKYVGCIISRNTNFCKKEKCHVWKKGQYFSASILLANQLLPSSIVQLRLTFKRNCRKEIQITIYGPWFVETWWNTFLIIFFSIYFYFNFSDSSNQRFSNSIIKILLQLIAKYLNTIEKVLLTTILQLGYFTR